MDGRSGVRGYYGSDESGSERSERGGADSENAGWTHWSLHFSFGYSMRAHRFYITGYQCLKYLMRERKVTGR